MKAALPRPQVCTLPNRSVNADVQGRVAASPRLSAGFSPEERVVPNRSFDTDAQVLQCATRTRLPVAGQLQR